MCSCMFTCATRAQVMAFGQILSDVLDVGEECLFVRWCHRLASPRVFGFHRSHCSCAGCSASLRQPSTALGSSSRDSLAVLDILGRPISKGACISAFHEDWKP